MKRLYEEARIALADPFCGWNPIKVIEGMSHGVPVVITDLLERQIFGDGDIGHIGLAVARRDDNGASFASWMQTLGTKEDVWYRIQKYQLDAIGGAFGSAAVESIFCGAPLKLELRLES